MFEEIVLRTMKEDDLRKVIPLYIDYYNNHENCCWTEATAFKRIHQAFVMEDAYCIIAEEKDEPVGFVLGCFQQYDDLLAFDIDEIVVKSSRQGHGLGTMMLQQLENDVRAKGAKLIQLTSVNDEMHHHFYKKLGFCNTTNLIGKNKFLG